MPKLRRVSLPVPNGISPRLDLVGSGSPPSKKPFATS